MDERFFGSWSFAGANSVFLNAPTSSSISGWSQDSLNFHPKRSGCNQWGSYRSSIWPFCGMIGFWSSWSKQAMARALMMGGCVRKEARDSRSIARIKLDKGAAVSIPVQMYGYVFDRRQGCKPSLPRQSKKRYMDRRLIFGVRMFTPLIGSRSVLSSGFEYGVVLSLSFHDPSDLNNNTLHIL